MRTCKRLSKPKKTEQRSGLADENGLEAAAFPSKFAPETSRRHCKSTLLHPPERGREGSCLTVLLPVLKLEASTNPVREENDIAVEYYWGGY